MAEALPSVNNVDKNKPGLIVLMKAIVGDMCYHCYLY
jgi:hypothetical protein